jgi:predicted transcriptional regulator
MRSARDEALETISKMPDTASMDDIMYRLYVLDKVRKGLEAAERGEVISQEDLQREIETW